MPRPLRALCVVLLLSVACGKAPTDVRPSEQTSDAGVDGGTAEPLRLVTWNLGNFAADSEEISRVKAHLTVTLDADLVAVQEVVDPASFEQLVAQLPGWSGELADEDKALGEQRVGVLWKTAAVVVTEPQSLFADAGSEFPRSVLRVNVAREGTTWSMYVVHLKAGIQPDDETKRIAAIRALTSAAAGVSGRSVIIGDFNEATGDARSPEFFAVLGDAGYEVPTLAAADAGEYSFLPARILLDHVAVRSPDGAQVPAAEVVRLDQAEADYQSVVSDHVPVLTTFAP